MNALTLPQFDSRRGIQQSCMIQSITEKHLPTLTVKNLAGRRLSRGVKTNTQPLAGDKEQICRTKQKIPPPQPPRLSTQPEQPLQSAVLHPFWRLPQCPS